MPTRTELVDFLDQLLRPPPGMMDSSNNGLQIEGRAEVCRAVFGVDACAALFEQAAALEADVVFVHHGLSWKDNQRFLIGLHARRLGILFRHGLSLYASHLPLDLHPEVGNNAVFAKQLGLLEMKTFCRYGGVEIGYGGRLPKPLSLAELVQQVDRLLGTTSRVIGTGPEPVRAVGIVSGGGADAAEECMAAGFDCLITGEAGHSHHHPIAESGVRVITAGHYRTETVGPKAVMARVAAQFPGLDCRFLDVPTGL